MIIEDDADDSMSELSNIVPDIEGVTHPEEIVRRLHKEWKRQGGVLKGKPRHSDRFLQERLTVNKTPIASLTPKLVGKTQIKRGDAEALLRFLLSNWPQTDGDDISEIEVLKYAPLLPAVEIEEIVDHIIALIDTSSEIPVVGSGRAIISGDEPRLPGRDIGEIIPEYFKQSDALFTVAAERTVVSQSQKTELIGFRNLMNALKGVEDEDGKERPLIWVLDMGRRIFDDLESRLRYLSFNQLQIRFKALVNFEDRGRDARWKWLQSRAVFVILDTKYEEPVDMKGLRRPNFVAHHVSFNAIPPEWARSPNFRTLYGRDLEELDQRSYSIFYRASGWPVDSSSVTADLQQSRYFGYAAFAAPSEEKVGRGLPLPPAGGSYEDASKAVYAAATEILRVRNEDKIVSISGKDAASQLRYLGFRLMRLDDFMQL